MVSRCCKWTITSYNHQLTDRDRTANNLLSCFNFEQQPLAPDPIIKETKVGFSDVKPTRP